MASDETGVNSAGLIVVTGLKEFRQAIKAVDDENPKRLKAGFNKAAAVVAQAAKVRTPKRSGAAAGSIRVASNTTAAQVRAGGAAAPYFGFLDYGNKPHQGHGVGPKDSHPRKFIPTGRILYPAFYANRVRVTDIIAGELRGLMRENGLGSE